MIERSICYFKTRGERRATRPKGDIHTYGTAHVHWIANSTSNTASASRNLIFNAYYSASASAV